MYLKAVLTLGGRVDLFVRVFCVFDPVRIRFEQRSGTEFLGYIRAKLHARRALQYHAQNGTLVHATVRAVCCRPRAAFSRAAKRAPLLLDRQLYTRC